MAPVQRVLAYWRKTRGDMHLLCYRLVKTLKVNAGKGLEMEFLICAGSCIPEGFKIT